MSTYLFTYDDDKDYPIRARLQIINQSITLGADVNESFILDALPVDNTAYVALEGAGKQAVDTDYSITTIEDSSITSCINFIGAEEGDRYDLFYASVLPITQQPG